MRLRVRVPSATQLQIFCVMKTYKTILMLLLAATTACSKDSAEPDTPGPKPSISMTLDYQSREYELGEVIEATLTITEKNPAADYFLLNTSCNGGKAVATVDGHELQWQAEQQIPYEIVNEEFSSKVLHLKITPQAGATAKQPFNFGIYAISADGTKVEKRIYAVSVNTAEIITNVECITPTINLEQQFKFILTATKENYAGDFFVQLSTEGNGFFILENGIAGNRFYCSADSHNMLSYQPHETGLHKIHCIVKDDICVSEVDIEVEVNGINGSLTNPEPGVYIYCNSLYYPSSAWNQEWEEQAEGVAIITEECRFLMAPDPVIGDWGGGEFTSVSDLTVMQDWSEAKFDYNGRKNTEALLNAKDVMRKIEFTEKCYNYDKDNPGKWYQPAAGQMYLIRQNLDEVQRCLSLIGGRKLKANEHYISSTAADGLHLWAISLTQFERIYFFLYEPDNRTYPVRDLQTEEL